MKLPKRLARGTAILNTSNAMVGRFIGISRARDNRGLFRAGFHHELKVEVFVKMAKEAGELVSCWVQYYWSPKVCEIFYDSPSVLFVGFGKGRRGRKRRVA